MLQGERVLKEPQVRLLAGECLLPVEAPAHQGGVARGVQDAREALGEEGAFEVLRVEAHPRNPREDLSRGAPTVLAPLVGEVALGVVVRDEPVVGLDEFRPALSAFWKCQSAMRCWMPNVVSEKFCQGRPFSISSLLMPRASQTALALLARKTEPESVTRVLGVSLRSTAL